MMAGASVESRLKTGLDHGLHTHYGSATALMASNMKTVTIGKYHIHPLLATWGVLVTPFPAPYATRRYVT